MKLYDKLVQDKFYELVTQMINGANDGERFAFRKRLFPAYLSGIGIYDSAA